MGRRAPKTGCCHRWKCNGLARQVRRSARRSRTRSSTAGAASRRLRFISATTSWFVGDGHPVPDVRQPLTRPNSWRPSSGNGRTKGRLAQRGRPAGMTCRSMIHASIGPRRKPDVMTGGGRGHQEQGSDCRRSKRVSTCRSISSRVRGRIIDESPRAWWNNPRVVGTQNPQFDSALSTQLQGMREFVMAPGTASVLLTPDGDKYVRPVDVR